MTGNLGARTGVWAGPLARSTITNVRMTLILSLSSMSFSKIPEATLRCCPSPVPKGKGCISACSCLSGKHTAVP